MADEALASVMAFTGATEPVARHLLQLSDNDTMQACQIFFEQPDIVSSLNATSSSTGPSSAPTNAQSSYSRPGGIEDAQGVIHIPDSDDEGDVQMGGTPGPRFGLEDDFEASGAAAAARSAQEDEDAAMARRLQEELYGVGGAGGPTGLGDDEVRAPIGRTTETLVAPEFGGLSGGMYAGGEENEADAEAFLEEMRRRRREQQVSGAYRATRTENPANPFSQSVWDEGPPGRAGGPAGGPAGAQSATSRRLAELYRPPREILTHLDWDDTRDEGKDQKKWILVNLQDMADFRCQMLNRDVWKDEGVQDIVREKFLFLQYDKDLGNARQFIQLYLPNEQHLNPDIYPYIAVVDPRTGEQMKVWSGTDCPTTAADFKEKLQEFLERYRFSGKNPVATTKAPNRVVKDVERMTEDEMLQLAMQNSLATANGGSGESSRPSIQDPDELTKSTGSSDKGKNKAIEEEAPAAAPAEEEQQDSIWAKIASDRPHSEPAAGTAGVTRIQFMSPSGKVVRRFAVTDSVRRLYEWLKAEPLGGEEKAGVEFEIKRVPQGTDLIVDLDKTIEEAGIKQSSLAVEFVG